MLCALLSPGLFGTLPNAWELISDGEITHFRHALDTQINSIICLIGRSSEVVLLELEQDNDVGKHDCEEGEDRRPVDREVVSGPEDAAGAEPISAGLETVPEGRGLPDEGGGLGVPTGV